MLVYGLRIVNALLGVPQTRAGNQHAQQKTPNVCPPGDAACGRGTDRANTCQELQQEPITQNDESRNRYEKDEDQGEDSRSGIKKDVGPHDAGDGTAGTEGGERRVEIKEDVGETRTNAAKEIEEQVGEVAEVIFHVVAENPEEEHVPGEMHEAAVQEHAGENREKRGFETAVACEYPADVGRDGGVGHHEGLVLVGRQCELIEKDDYVRQNENRIDDRIGPTRVQVFDRDEHSLARCGPGSV